MEKTNETLEMLKKISEQLEPVSEYFKFLTMEEMEKRKRDRRLSLEGLTDRK